MRHNDVVDVLTAVAAADRRTVGDADVAIWKQVIGDLPLDAALLAVRGHLREQPGVWLEPGHIFQRARLLMRDQLEREADQSREERRAELDAKAEPDPEPPPFVGEVKHVRPRQNWLAVRCPHCNAPATRRCTVPGTGRPPYGGTHPARLDAAQLEAKL